MEINDTRTNPLHIDDHDNGSKQLSNYDNKTGTLCSMYVITIQTINETPDPCSVDIEFEKVDSNHILCKLFYMCQGKS